jgi:hypothetical protein
VKAVEKIFQETQEKKSANMRKSDVSFVKHLIERKEDPKITRSHPIIKRNLSEQLLLENSFESSSFSGSFNENFTPRCLNSWRRSGKFSEVSEDMILGSERGDLMPNGNLKALEVYPSEPEGGGDGIRRERCELLYIKKKMILKGTEDDSSGNEKESRIFLMDLTDLESSQENKDKLSDFVVKMPTLFRKIEN